ncbi:XRE family transcriptional regulator [Streptomyces sp. H39-C1]|uniref:XRE family transcriptional regulator n=1 Tax=Streptomyces sp. H39-C1 TaxID=3004355 RepID=UPI0022AE9B81|nr:XRE family transcriptional regulator [Streptomyces sp. H39-C1]MCZ4101081.1 XRE family transcriptional regulator [Streptomyces sp. H39-C1]
MSHRAWLELVRAELFASRLTLHELGELAGFSKTRMSELLRGKGVYPRWKTTYQVIHALGMQPWPMRRLWAAAAREAQKKETWISNCINGVGIAEMLGVAPVDHRGFTEGNRAPYTAYAEAFLFTNERASWVVKEAFDMLWLRWDAVLASPDVRKSAWKLFRGRVMERAGHTEGRPDLRPLAFTGAHDHTSDLAAQFARVGELLALFEACRDLPDTQLDVMVLKYYGGLDDTATANVLGVPLAAVCSADRYAKRTLTRLLNLPPGRTSQ